MITSSRNAAPSAAPLFLLGLLLLWPTACLAQIALGVVPGPDSAIASARQAEELADTLNTSLGEEVRLRIFSDHEQLIEWMLRYRMVDLSLLDRQTVQSQPNHPFFAAGELAGSEEIFVMRPGTRANRLARVREALKNAVFKVQKPETSPASAILPSAAALSPQMPPVAGSPAEVSETQVAPPPAPSGPPKTPKAAKKPARKVSRRDRDKRPGFDSGKYAFEVEVGFGYDSNVYLAPDRSYLDPFAKEVIHPERKTGFFVPVEVEADISIGPPRLKWVTSADFDGQFYTETILDNADTHYSTIDSGLDMLLHKKGKDKTTLYIGPTLAYKKKIYFDSDTGLDKGTLSSQKEMSDRYNYFCRGLEAELDGRLSRFEYTIEGKIAEYDYEEVGDLSSLDYHYWRAEAELEYALTKTTTAGLYYKYHVNDYDDRRARTREGKLLSKNPQLLYTYNDIGFYLEQEFGKRWLLSLEYDYLTRDDDYVGYNDYKLNRFTATGEYRDKKGRKLELEVVYWAQHYPNAYAFDKAYFTKTVLAEGEVRVRKINYRTWEAALEGEYPLYGPWSLWMEQNYVDQYSSDPRYAYRRYQAMAGLKLDY